MPRRVLERRAVIRSDDDLLAAIGDMLRADGRVAAVEERHGAGEPELVVRLAGHPRAIVVSTHELRS